MKPHFNIEILPEAVDFLDQLADKPREKIYYNMSKARFIQNAEIFKKLNKNIWEFRTLYEGISYRLFAFWYNNDSEQTFVIASHGIIKKSNKTPTQEIKKAEEIRKNFLENKQKER